jgi:hypothetical protein
LAATSSKRAAGGPPSPPDDRYRTALRITILRARRPDGPLGRYRPKNPPRCTVLRSPVLRDNTSTVASSQFQLLLAENSTAFPPGRI